jgi:outer membrane murein-binding lipoprotein Lpp
MKKVIAIFAIAALAACGGASTEAKTDTAAATVDTAAATVDTAAKAVDTAAKAVDTTAAKK